MLRFAFKSSFLRNLNGNSLLMFKNGTFKSQIQSHQLFSMTKQNLSTPIWTNLSNNKFDDFNAKSFSTTKTFGDDQVFENKEQSNKEKPNWSKFANDEKPKRKQRSFDDENKEFQKPRNDAFDNPNWRENYNKNKNRNNDGEGERNFSREKFGNRNKGFFEKPRQRNNDEFRSKERFGNRTFEKPRQNRFKDEGNENEDFERELFSERFEHRTNDAFENQRFGNNRNKESFEKPKQNKFNHDNYDENRNFSKERFGNNNRNKESFENQDRLGNRNKEFTKPQFEERNFSKERFGNNNRNTKDSFEKPQQENKFSRDKFNNNRNKDFEKPQSSKRERDEIEDDHIFSRERFNNNKNNNNRNKEFEKPRQFQQISLNSQRKFTFSKRNDFMPNLVRDPNATFKSLGISDFMIERLKEQSIEKPTDIQIDTISAMNANTNNRLLIQAQTGTGKTLAYLLPMFEKLRTNRNLTFVIVCPSRELTNQIIVEIDKLRNTSSPNVSEEDKKIYSSISWESFVRDVPLSADIQRIQANPPNFIVGLASRLVPLFGQIDTTAFEVEAEFDDFDEDEGANNIDSENIKPKREPRQKQKQPQIKQTKESIDFVNKIDTIVIDEANYVLKPLARYSDEQRREVRRSNPRPGEEILNQLTYVFNSTARFVFVSASFNATLRALLQSKGWALKSNSTFISHGWRVATQNIQHQVYTIDEPVHVLGRKNMQVPLRHIAHFYKTQISPEPALLFIPTHHSVDVVVDKLVSQFKLSAFSLYKISDSTSSFKKLINALKNKEVNLVVSGDLSAPGLDFQELSNVLIGYFPSKPDEYLHLAGRVGRFGQKKIGKVTSFPRAFESYVVDRFETQLNLKFEKLNEVKESELEKENGKKENDEESDEQSDVLEEEEMQTKK